jgi:hypothetical protein
MLIFRWNLIRFRKNLEKGMNTWQIILPKLPLRFV